MIPQATDAEAAPVRSPESTGTVTRERILDEAGALFAEKGFAATSMRDIAGRVGLTAASLYNHFRGKDDLYGAVLQRGIRPLLDRMQDLGSSEGGDAATESLIRGVMEHLGRRPHLPRLIHHEVVTGGAHIARLAREWVRPMVDHGIAEMKRNPRGHFDPDDFPLVIAAWIHLVLGHFALAPLFRDVFDEDPLSAEMLTRQTEVLLEFARGAMSRGDG